jgi:hypothetical protein
MFPREQSTSVDFPSSLPVITSTSGPSGNICRQRLERITLAKGIFLIQAKFMKAFGRSGKK